MNADPNRILEMTSAFFDSCVLFTASDAGVFSALAELAAAEASTLAERLNMNPRGMRLLLDGCVAVGLLEKDGPQYRNTPETQMFLTPNSPADLSKAIRYNRDVYNAWGLLPELLQTGQPVEKPELHLGDDASRTRTFVLSMHHRALGIGRAVVPMLDLTDRKKLLDVGGGPGTYSVLLAQANPQLHSTVLDLPAVVAIAGELIAEAGMADRVKTVGGDYHTAEFPPDQDVVNFFGVLHQESPESIVDLFRRAHAALKPGGVVHVMDMMTDATRTAPKFSALFAINMALTTDNGWVFSDEDVKGWLAEAGFVNPTVQTLPAPMPHWLVRAEKAY